jgi:alpha-mannosidase
LARKTEDDLGQGAKRQVFLLENRFFSAKFDAVTGMLRSIFTNRSRYNQLSRQIAFRHNKEYSIQTADEMIVTKSTAEIGELRMTGRLVSPGGELVARYSETITIRSESRLLESDLTLEPLAELDDDRWNSYFAVRYAWNDQTLEMQGGLNDGVHPLPDRVYRHSPKFVDLRKENESLTFFSEGLPFHRRSGDRHLDTLLIVKGESQRTFPLAIGVNVQQPAMTAWNFLLQKKGLVFPIQGVPKHSSSWLFQIESKSVIALHWGTIAEEGKAAGLIVYLLETEGRRAHFALRSFLPPKEAAVINFHGKELKSLKVDTDAVLIDMHGYELLPVKIKMGQGV